MDNNLKIEISQKSVGDYNGKFFLHTDLVKVLCNITDKWTITRQYIDDDEYIDEDEDIDEDDDSYRYYITFDNLSDATEFKLKWF